MSPAGPHSIPEQPAGPQRPWAGHSGGMFVSYLAEGCGPESSHSFSTCMTQGGAWGSAWQGGQHLHGQSRTLAMLGVSAGTQKNKTKRAITHNCCAQGPRKTEKSRAFLGRLISFPPAIPRQLKSGEKLILLSECQCPLCRWLLSTVPFPLLLRGEWPPPKKHILGSLGGAAV